MALAMTAQARYDHGVGPAPRSYDRRPLPAAVTVPARRQLTEIVIDDYAACGDCGELLDAGSSGFQDESSAVVCIDCAAISQKEV